MVGVFLAVAFYVALLLVVAMHEVLGHGGAAVVVGGSLEGIFITPIGGVASTHSPDSPGDWKRLATTAGGPAINIIVGTLLWPLLRRIRGFAPRVLVCDVAFGSLVSAIIYVGVAPLLELAMGTRQGDGTLLFAALGVSPLLPALAASLAGIGVTALGMRRAQELVQIYLAPVRPVAPFAATWQLLWPGVGLVSLYFAAVSPELAPVFFFSYPFTLVLFLIYTALGAGLLALHRRRARAPAPIEIVPSGYRGAYPSAGEMVRWSGAGFLVGLACLLVFGAAPP